MSAGLLSPVWRTSCVRPYIQRPDLLRQRLASDSTGLLRPESGLTASVHNDAKPNLPTRLGAPAALCEVHHAPRDPGHYDHGAVPKPR